MIGQSEDEPVFQKTGADADRSSASADASCKAANTTPSRGRAPARSWCLKETLTTRNQPLPTVLIDLNHPASVVRYEGSAQLIHAAARSRVLRLLRASIEKIKRADGALPKRRNLTLSLFEDHEHNTIAVFGSRGSGKTTFLRNILQRLADADYSNADGTGSRSDSSIEDEAFVGTNSHVLGVIDPTLVERKQNLMLAIVERINRACLNATDNARQSSSPDEAPLRQRQALEALAPALTLLDGVGPERLYDGWDDEQYVLEDGMRAERARLELSQRFNTFIKCSLDLLGKQAFVLAFDDIDTQFDNGWPVLELIRKHLVSSRMLVLMSGDLRLYSRLVRRAQWTNLGTTLTSSDRPSGQFHSSSSLRPWEADPLVRLIDHLEDQYLTKILPPQYRIGLGSIAQYLRQQAMQIQLRLPGTGDEISLLDAGRALVRQTLFVQLRPEQDDYLYAIFEQPTRTVVQWLKAAEPLLSLSTQPDAPTMRDGATASAHARQYGLALTDVLASVLYQRGIEPDALHASGEGLMAALLGWLQREELWDSGPRLRPDYAEQERNLVTMAFATRLAHAFDQEKGQALSFLLRIGLSAQLMRQGSSPDDRRRLGLALAFDRREPATTVARLGVAVQRALAALEPGASQEPRMARGIVPVVSRRSEFMRVIASQYLRRAVHTPDEASKQFDAWVRSITKGRPSGDKDELILSWWTPISRAKPYRSRQKPQNPRYLGYLYHTLTSLSAPSVKNGRLVNLAACLVADGRGQDTGYLSVFNLLGVMAELLVIGEAHTASDGLNEAVSERLLRLTQLRSYPMPQLSPERLGGVEMTARAADESGDSSDETDTDEEPSSTLDAEVISSRFLLAMQNWVDRARRHDLQLPPSTLNRILVRTFFSLSRMDEDVPRHQIYAGHLLHRQIIVLLNAILVEEMISRGVLRRDADGRETSPVLDNPTGSDRPFFQNFPDQRADYCLVSGESDPAARLKLFPLVFSCPIWALFLSPDARGNLPASCTSLLHCQISTWTCDWNGTSDEERKKLFEAVKVELSVPGSNTAPVEFENLWAPLNSVPVLRPGSFTKAPSSKPSRGRNSKEGSLNNPSNDQSNGNPQSSKTNPSGLIADEGSENSAQLSVDSLKDSAAPTDAAGTTNVAEE